MSSSSIPSSRSRNTSSNDRSKRIDGSRYLRKEPTSLSDKDSDDDKTSQLDSSISYSDKFHQTNYSHDPLESRHPSACSSLTRTFRPSDLPFPLRSSLKSNIPIKPENIVEYLFQLDDHARQLQEQLDEERRINLIQRQELEALKTREIAKRRQIYWDIDDFHWNIGGKILIL